MSERYVGGAGRASARMGFGSVDGEAVARAEAALKSLSAQFSVWLEEEVVKIEAAMHAAALSGIDSAAGETLYLRAHDLKGLGSTYEFPIITRIAAALCRLIDTPEHRTTAPLALVEAHVAAICSAARDGVKTAEDPRGAPVIADLECRVAAHLGA